MSRKMQCVVFDGPYKVSLQQRPEPRIQDEQDIVVKVQATALCGSELHVYRGHQPSATGFIMGHEFSGTAVSAGSAVKTVQVGDKVVSSFTVSCGNCFFCRTGASARCLHVCLFGTKALDGAQAEFMRVPLADGTVVKAPEGVLDEALVLMADIFPTGYFGVKSAIEMSTSLAFQDATVVILGCGPVGLCAVTAAAHFKPKHLFAVDSVDGRLQLSRKLGAEPLNFSNDKEAMFRRIEEVTDRRGADIVIEVVGLSSALRMAFDMVRPFGIISSIGVHNGEIPWTGKEAYGKNVWLEMGRCPVRSVFAEALELLKIKQEQLSFMFENILPLSDAVRGYELFNESKVQKIIFKP